jgi:hypothetical protein
VAADPIPPAESSLLAFSAGTCPVWSKRCDRDGSAGSEAFADPVSGAAFDHTRRRFGWS